MRLGTHLLLRPEDVPASRTDWEVIGTFNPGAVRFGEDVVLLIRIAERPREVREGWTALPRWSVDKGEYVVDWMRNDDLEVLDPRVVRRKADGLVRLTFVSHLRVATSRNGLSIDSLSGPAFSPKAQHEEFGIEDPRITFLDGKFYITYVSVSRHGASTALASTSDFESFTRHGVIFCPENKDVVLFPQTIGQSYFALHRPVGGTPFTTPQMWLASSPDLIHWGNHQFIYGGEQAWETGRVGAGTPPIELPDGWLEIYHGNERPLEPGKVGAYYGAAMLLDRNNPTCVLKVGEHPILRPELDFETQGFVADVVFPTGLVEADDRLLVYYGASDRYTGVAELSRVALMGDLLAAHKS
ncbi:MAG: glycoside hydrolase family 130 protein [Pirellulales bacterium]